jgi:UDP-N-acetylmuramate--alanine ligase
MSVPDRGPIDLSTPRRIHVVGVGGAGMSAYASVLVAMGHTVSGSDLKPSGALERLEAGGVTVAVGHDPSNVEDAEVVAVSSAVGTTNPEVVEATRRGIDVVSRADLLAAIAASRRTVAVAGTHGKTTTTSMVALVMVEAGLHPSFLVGGDLNEIGTNAVWDEGGWLVLEADESDGTFLRIDPDVAVVTNVEADHLDHYGDRAGVERAFEAFCASRRGRPLVVGCDDPVAAELGRHHGGDLVGFEPGATWRIENLVQRRAGSAFDLVRGDDRVALRLPVPGRHNAQNAALAAVAAYRAGAPLEAAAAALARFAGVTRRFEFRGEANGVAFVDDYAHHPTEVAAALEAAAHGGWERIVAVFQPHRYTRTAALGPEFADAFGGADVVVVTDVYAAGEPPLPGVSGRIVADAVAHAHPELDVDYVAGRGDLRSHLEAVLQPGDLCLTLGAGDLTSLADELTAGGS